eukprot:m.254115 g.254115  ORF g.254115 m.254115 type:complete len:200 (+) comp18786_c0_seq1:503-1102(+)
MPATICKQPSPLPEKVSDVIPDISPELTKLLESTSLESQKYFTSCICANCGIHPEFTFGCSRKAFCFKCVHQELACNCFHLEKEAPYCEFAQACFLLKCCLFFTTGSFCDMPFPMDNDFHMLCCNCEKQVTVCGGGHIGKAICCTYSGLYTGLNCTEVECAETSRCFCLECRCGLGCLPGVKTIVPLMCAFLGKELCKF